MATKWDPIDPQDIVDLWVDFGPADKPPFIPAGEDITNADITVPDGVLLVTSGIEGKKVRIRTGPNNVGKHMLNYHLTTDTGQEFNADVILVVKERVKGG